MSKNADVEKLKPLFEAHESLKSSRKRGRPTAEAALVAKLKAMSPEVREAHLAALAAAVEA